MSLKIEFSGKTEKELDNSVNELKKTIDMKSFTLIASGVIKSSMGVVQLSAPTISISSSSVSLVEILITRTDSRGQLILWEIGANSDLSGDVPGISIRNGTISDTDTISFISSGPPIGSFYIRATELSSGLVNGVSPITQVSISQPVSLANPNPTASPMYESVELTFTEDVNANSFRIEKRLAGDLFSVVSENASSPYLVTGLINGTEYEFRVTAVSNDINYTSSSGNVFSTPVNDFDVVSFDLESAITAVKNDPDPTIVLEKGKIYYMETYSRITIDHDLTIICNDGIAELKWGKDYYNQWRETGESEVIFFLGTWNNHIKIVNVNLSTGLLIDQVQPWYRTLFLNNNTTGQTGTIELINSNTSLEYGFLYSGSQSNYLTAIAKQINFTGIIWQEFKAPNGGGLLSQMEDCELTQIDPITRFQANFTFAQGLITSDVSFDLVENKFQSLPGSNASTIVYFDNISFLLPAGLETDPFTHAIRPIPLANDVISMDIVQYGGTKYLSSNTNELQVGDIISIGGTQYTIQVKDRASFANGYPTSKALEYALNTQPPEPVGAVSVTVISSIGESLIGGPARSGYMIYKDNRNFQTNLSSPPSLEEYMFLTNPFGVLSYNNKEITFWAKNVNHNGFYRQTSSGVGYSNGYTLINCTGYEDEFNPDVPINYN